MFALRFQAATVTAVTLTLILGACASTGGGSSPTEDRFTRDLGRTGFGVLEEGINKVILNKYSYRIRRSEAQSNLVYYETDWVQTERSANPDDPDLIEEQTRIVLRARRGPGNLFRVTFEGERMVRTTMRTNWHQASPTQAFNDYMDRIATDLMLEIRTGVVGDA